MENLTRRQFIILAGKTIGLGAVVATLNACGTPNPENTSEAPVEQKESSVSGTYTGKPLFGTVNLNDATSKSCMIATGQIITVTGATTPNLDLVNSEVIDDKGNPCWVLKSPAYLIRRIDE